MSELVERYAKAAQAVANRRNGGRQQDRARQDDLPPKEAQALSILRREAKQRGSVLASGGKGGLPASLVLHVLRRDKYRCKRCGEKGNEENGGITLHHKGGIVDSKWLNNKGHHNDPNNVVTLCMRCHDAIHETARAKGEDSRQVTPKGDEGTRRDHGKPPARPER